jgi:hypothetical protein
LIGVFSHFRSVLTNGEIRERGRSYNREGSGLKGERESDGSIRAKKEGNASGAKGPYKRTKLRTGSDAGMRLIKPSNKLPERKAKLYQKAKAETHSLTRTYGDDWQRWSREAPHRPKALTG